MEKSFVGSIPFLLAIVSVVIYISCDQKSDPYEVSSIDKALILPIIKSKKIEVAKSGHIKNVMWNSLSNEELELAFRIEPIRKCFEDGWLSKLEFPRSYATISVLGKQYNRMLEAYDKTKK